VPWYRYSVEKWESSTYSYRISKKILTWRNLSQVIWVHYLNEIELGRKLTGFSWLRKETILKYMRACHNVHTPMHGPCCCPFINSTSAQTLISSIGTLPSGVICCIVCLTLSSASPLPHSEHSISQLRILQMCSVTNKTDKSLTKTLFVFKTSYGWTVQA
jgi:hypothetical protein